MPAIAPMPGFRAPMRGPLRSLSSAPSWWRFALSASALGALAGCSSLGNFGSRVADITNVITPYKVEIVQGNFVSREQVAALQPGMARAQVREVLGSPLVTSAFHTDRWDYVFTLRRQGVQAQSRKLTVFFKNDLFDRVEGDTMPSEAEFVSQIDQRRNLGKVPLLEVPEQVLREFGAKNPGAGAAALAPTVAAAAVATSYPPLEVAGAQTQAWDASTQRAATLAAAARPAAASVAAVTPAAVSVAAVAPAAVTPAVLAQAPVLASPAATTPLAQAPSVAQSAPQAMPAPAAAQAIAAPRVAVPSVVAPAVVAAGSVAATAAQAPVAAVASVAAAVPAAVVAQAAPRVTPPPASVPAPVPSNTPFSSVEPELGGFLAGWMNDWRSRNSLAFFSRYAPEFTGTSASRAEWEALRRPRIEAGTGMSLGVLDVRTRMVSPTEARVVFRQMYESSVGSEVGTKALFMVKRGGSWLIEREFFTPAQ